MTVDRVLVVNVGSSSLKLDLVEPDGTVSDSQHIDGWDGQTEPIAELLHRHHPDAVGHRVVHGGDTFHGAALVDDQVIAGIEALVPLDPGHQPRALAGLRAAQDAGPQLPHVVCFDTTFHRTMPLEASTYAVPRPWIEDFGVRRYGFHGLSHAYVARRAAQLVDQPPDELRTVSCHLGSGASLCAIKAGHSVDTTMGLTPLDGLVMGTRPGTIDPGLVNWLVSEHGMTLTDIDQQLHMNSGLLGLGGSADLAELLRSDEQAAKDAVAVYVHRLCGSIAAMTASLGGLDVLVYTGGVGQNVPELRALVAQRLSYLGIGIDHDANTAADGDTDISQHDDGVRTLVVGAREELTIAEQTRVLLANS